MRQDWKFQQRWEFRRRDDNFDSSSDDSKSSSKGEPVLRKHKLVSSLILPWESPGSQQKDQFETNIGCHLEFGKANKIHIGLRKKNRTVKRKRGSFKDTNKKKNKCITHEPVSLDRFKIFMVSILEELKVARENMFKRMKEEMKKLVAVETASRPRRKEHSHAQRVSLLQHQNSIETCKKTQNCNSGCLEESIKANRMDNTNNCCDISVKRANYEQPIGAITSNEKVEGEGSRFSVKNPKCSSSTPDQSGPAGNNTDVSSERANLMIDVSAQQGYFPCIQREDQFESFAQRGSKNMGSFNQHDTQTSTVGTGFLVPLHQGLDNGFNIPRKILQENSSQYNNVSGLRLNGGAIRFSGESYALSEHTAAINFHSHLNYRTDCGGMAFGNKDHQFPN